MRGFIEIHDTAGKRLLVNVANIVSVHDEPKNEYATQRQVQGATLGVVHGFAVNVRATYDQIRAAIQNANG